jgi:protein-disulfide isomerase
MNDLTSSQVPRIGPSDHVRGSGLELTLYFDLACPACALAWAELAELELRLCFRHFPLRSKRPRSPALHAATEAAAAQRPEAFWEMVELIYTDHGRQDDPHLWQRAELLGLDLGQFDHDRRSEPVAARVRADFEAGIRAGVTGTPTAFLGSRKIDGPIAETIRRSERPL